MAKRALAIRREMRHGKFVYLRRNQVIRSAREIRRIEALAVPPAWTNVEISSSDSAKVLARGIDAAGRTQTIYHPAFRRRQDQKKYDRMLRFARALPRLRAQVDRDLRRRALSRDRVTACVVRLMDDHLFRVGNRQYARKHGSYGMTTLRKRHVTVSGDELGFDFVGKSGRRHRRALRDARAARLIERLTELPGSHLFQYLDEHNERGVLNSHDVNRYIRRHAGSAFSAKDFRTWGATVAATAALLTASEEDRDRPARMAQASRDAVKMVGDLLGNTAAVARASYIDPRVLTAFNDSRLVHDLHRRQRRFRDRPYRRRDEQATLALLAMSPARSRAS